jgi:PLP dependent protein
MTGLELNLRSVQARIRDAALRSGRCPDEIELIAVTKSQPPKTICKAYELGLRHFGENRVEEAASKVGQLPADIRWHMIGHIQSRKANRVIALFQWAHSVDSLKLAQRLDRLWAEPGKRFPVLLEFNVSGEETKHGFPAWHWEHDNQQQELLLEAMRQIVSLPNVSVQGLMTMAPIVTEPEAARPVFASLRQLRDRLAARFPEANWHHLSMGMTDDFEVAIEEGATLVRIGRAIFAPDQGPLCLT